MTKKILSGFIWVGLAVSAQASGLDDLLKGVGNIQRTVQQAQSATGMAPAAPAAPPASVATPVPATGGRRIEPDWFTIYPRAQVRREFVNPFDSVILPLSQPAVGATTTRYAMPMEGKVTMLQYSHEADDSPLLIQRHYDALLAQQGYERVIACASPCPAASAAVYWMKMLDPNGKMDHWAFPDAPRVLIGYKADAMAFVAVGKNNNYAYTSFVKLVDGAITNRTDLDAWLASLKPVAPPTPATPAIVAPQAGAAALPVALPQSDVVESIAPVRLQNAIAQTRGPLFVMLTSRDPKCPHCIRANPRYAELAAKHANTGRFVTVNWEPWPKAFEHEFVKSKGIGGLPAYLAFTDGVQTGRVDGNVPVEELEQKLFKGSAKQ